MHEMFDDGVKKLPKKRKLSPAEFVNRHSLTRLILMGLGLYCILIILFTCFQKFLIYAGKPVAFQAVIKGGEGHLTVPIEGVIDLLYFNFVTVMTIGYGDITPSGWGRIIVCLEALVGLIVFGIVVSASVLKLTLPRNSTVVFSRYCYFTKDDEKFVVVFINTTCSRIVNADICSLLKLGRRNLVCKPSFRTPYVGDSVWPLSVNSLNEYRNDKEIKQYDYRRLTLYPDDGLKFGIDGAIGIASFSASVKYGLEDCWVLDKKSDLPTTVLEEPKFGDPVFESAFHFIPRDGLRFTDWAKQNGAKIHDAGKKETARDMPVLSQFYSPFFWRSIC